MANHIAEKNDVKKIFRKKGTCSRTFYYLLDREFGNVLEKEERAADPLAGGILQKGYQCGMLWGATLATGTEAYWRLKDSNKAIALAIMASQHLVRSFKESAQTVNCREITKTDFSKKFQILKYLLFKTRGCFNLAEKWAPEAVKAAEEGLSYKEAELPEQTLSCASEVVRKMGGSDEEIITVAGFAGGIGLSGYACGALSAAIWRNSRKWIIENPEKPPYNNNFAKNTYRSFCKASNGEILCHKITGKHFETIEQHSEFIKKGGCANLIDTLVTT